MDKPKARKKTRKPYDTIELSDDEPQDAKREEETILAKDTLPIPKTDAIEKFMLSMVNRWWYLFFEFFKREKPKLKKKPDEE
ncbi:hypothetical protein R1flu_002382 [Riccia fluitans]|uniref:Uncharacterized protein n=1 Tax=Riccia fluitans TaxID=41844 RepID=A0ABD1Y8W9_9MARC